MKIRKIPSILISTIMLLNPFLTVFAENPVDVPVEVYAPDPDNKEKTVVTETVEGDIKVEKEEVIGTTDGAKIDAEDDNTEDNIAVEAALTVTGDVSVTISGEVGNATGVEASSTNATATASIEGDVTVVAPNYSTGVDASSKSGENETTTDNDTSKTTVSSESVTTVETGNINVKSTENDYGTSTGIKASATGDNNETYVSAENIKVEGDSNAIGVNANSGRDNESSSENVSGSGNKTTVEVGTIEVTSQSGTTVETGNTNVESTSYDYSVATGIMASATGDNNETYVSADNIKVEGNFTANGVNAWATAGRDNESSSEKVSGSGNKTTVEVGTIEVTSTDYSATGIIAHTSGDQNETSVKALDVTVKNEENIATGIQASSNSSFDKSSEKEEISGSYNVTTVETGNVKAVSLKGKAEGIEATVRGDHNDVNIIADDVTAEGKSSATGIHAFSDDPIWRGSSVAGSANDISIVADSVYATAEDAIGVKVEANSKNGTTEIKINTDREEGKGIVAEMKAEPDEEYGDVYGSAKAIQIVAKNDTDVDVTVYGNVVATSEKKFTYDITEEIGVYKEEIPNETSDINPSYPPSDYAVISVDTDGQNLININVVDGSVISNKSSQYTFTVNGETVESETVNEGIGIHIQDSEARNFNTETEDIEYSYVSGNNSEVHVHVESDNPEEGNIENTEMGLVVLLGEESKTTVDVITTGRIEAEVPILVNENVTSDNLKLTLWQVDLTEADDGAEHAVVTKSVSDDGRETFTTTDNTKEIEKNIQYIIKVEQPEGATLSTQGTTKVQGTDDEYEVAKENDRVLLKIDLNPDFYLEGAYNGLGEKVPLYQDAAGNYYIDVPRGGGVYLSAKLGRRQSDSGSDDDSPVPVKSTLEILENQTSVEAQTKTGVSAEDAAIISRYSSDQQVAIILTKLGMTDALASSRIQIKDLAVKAANGIQSDLSTLIKEEELVINGEKAIWKVIVILENGKQVKYCFRMFPDGTWVFVKM